MKKIKHSSFFVAGIADFLCFIFPKLRAGGVTGTRSPNGLIIIDKVMQGGIIGGLFL
jgi:hypothetical protein